MNAREVALSLLKIALAIFPPLAALVTKALEGTSLSEDERPLADMVREILPVQAPIHQAVADLEKK